MRRILGLVLLGLAGFMIAMAALVKFYAYPTLAVVPTDQDSTSYSVGEDMTYFSVAERKEMQDTLTTKVRIIGDVEASEEAGDDVAVWDKSVITTTSDGTEISVDTERFAFDRNDASAVDCCDANVNDEPVTYKGLITKFPMNTQKQDYEYWDGDLQDTATFKYEDTEDFDGLTVYRFRMDIPRTKVGEMDIPSGILGEAPGEVLTAETWYANERTYWVEPETGAMVKVQESLDSALVYEGEDRVTTTRGVTGFPEEDVQKNIADYKELGGQLHLLRVTAPIGGLVIGLVLGLLGALLLASDVKARRKKAQAATA